MRYGGSKQRKAKQIVRSIPYDVENYVEPFAGLFSVYLRLLKDRKHIKSAVINDLDPDWYSWAMMLRGDNQDYGDFLERLQECRDRFLPETDHGEEIRAEFEDCKGRWVIDGDPFAWFFLRCFAAGQYVGRNRPNIASFNARNIGHGVNRWTLKKAQQWREALQFATITNVDAFQLIRSLGKKDFAYVDPPYYPYLQVFEIYPCELDAKQHETLGRILQKSKCRWMLSMNDAPPTRKIYCLPEYACRLMTYTYSGIAARSNDRKVDEWLNRNYVL